MFDCTGIRILLGFLRPRSFGVSVMHTILKHFIGLNIKYQALEKHEMTDHNSKTKSFPSNSVIYYFCT